MEAANSIGTNNDESNNAERAQAAREGSNGSNPPRRSLTSHRKGRGNEFGFFEDEEDASAFANIDRFSYTEHILPLKHQTSPEFCCDFGRHPTERGQERLGFFLARASHLTRVRLVLNGSASSFSRVLRGPFEDHNLEHLNIDGSFIRDGDGEPMRLDEDDLTCIGNYVESARSLKVFELDSFEVGMEGMEILSNALNRARPQHLVFRWMHPERGALRALLRSQFTRSLEYLELIRFRLERDAFEALVEILSDKNATLSRLNVFGVAIDHTVSIIFTEPVDHTFARMLCHALEGNDTLRTLELDFQNLSDESHKYFEKLLFNDSSLDGIYDSNHTINFLLDVGSGSYGNNLLGSLVQINRAVCDGGSSDNIALRRRKKIVKYLRLGNSFNATPFHALDLEILPYALQFVGKQFPVELTNHRDAFFKVDEMYQIILSSDVDTLFGK